jgi:hypothetical protein
MVIEEKGTKTEWTFCELEPGDVFSAKHGHYYMKIYENIIGGNTLHINNAIDLESSMFTFFSESDRVIKYPSAKLVLEP